MANAKELQTIREQLLYFLRGRYLLDELGNGKDELKFRRGGKTVLTVYIREDRYDCLLIFGKAEREKFDLERNSFSQTVQAIYDGSTTYHDGKWMLFSVDSLEMLEEIKRLVQIKKKPNRKPFPKEQAVYAKCGHRCDLCIHYIGARSVIRCARSWKNVWRGCMGARIGLCAVRAVPIKATTYAMA